MSTLLFARTLVHLRTSQLLYRVIRRIQSPVPQTRAQYRGVDTARTPLLEEAMGRWASIQPPPDLARVKALQTGRFQFLDHAARLNPVNWNARHVSPLWNYNLHYFEYAVELALSWQIAGDMACVRSFEYLALDWIARVAKDSDGWQPYPLSIRIASWCKALLLFGDALAPDARERISLSLFRQLEVLSRRVEWDILANHVQKNLHALLVGSLFFAGHDAARWGAFARSHLWRQLDEQVLADGGHYERSPMYHALALGDFLEDVLLLRAVGEPVPQAVLTRLVKMAEALVVLARTDGSLHLLNDAADGSAPDTRGLTALAARVLGVVPGQRRGAWSLSRTGYFGSRQGDGEGEIIIDCGGPTPSYQPGHAHCGILSFELDAFGRQIIVDSGVHGYDDDPYREFVRSTRAHNTVMIDGREQSEIWATFRMARRAEIAGVHVEAAKDQYYLKGAYRPFHDRRMLHEREFLYSRAEVTVTDTVRNAPGVPLRSFLHLHPDFTARIEEGSVLATAHGVRVIIRPFGNDSLAIRRGESEPIQGWYCPRFGVALDNAVVVMGVGANAESPFGYRIAVDKDVSGS